VRLRAHLNGAPGEPPDEWVISRICEEFGCLPSAAIRELEDGDADVLFTVLEMRSYARAKAHVDGAKKQGDLKMTPAVRRVFEIEHAAMQAERDTR
jgi:hypothetical protein